MTRAAADDVVALLLTRHQLRRDSGTPCVSAFVGDPARSRAAFSSWTAARGLACAVITPDVVLMGLTPRVDDDVALGLLIDGHHDAARAARYAAHLAVRAPRVPVAVFVDEQAWEQLVAPDRPATWRDLLIGGRILIRRARKSSSSSSSSAPSVARSAAELALFQLLEADVRTRGRFRLNERLGFRFGRGPAEVDLCAIDVRVAVEVDGPHHFADVEAWRRDRRKDVLLQRHGFFVVRVVAADAFAAGAAVVDTIADVVALRSTIAGQR
ncbi:MAG: DUF559 domain-containing protein [Deltaproteobacteria bacterium]|nr:DUF559 domain-containing protein [Deltaproteobacteria bacterium]